MTTLERIAAFSFRGKGIPEHMHEGLAAYIDSGRPTGSFLEAVLSDRLLASCANADEDNLDALTVYPAFPYNEAPSGCSGSAENYADWIERGGLNGKKA